MAGGSFLLTLLFSLSMLTSCKDELTLIEDPSSDGVEIEGDCIAFTMALDKDLSTRADGYDFTSGDAIEKYENYIDTQDKFRVFFFTEGGDFLFGATDRTVSSLLSTSDSQTDYWYVRIPMTMIVDRDNNEYDINKIKDYLKNHSFKVAVLANWPNGGEKVNPADWDDSEGTSSGENPSSTLKGNPLWNWNNSILNKDADPSDIRNINDLHHVYNDLYYGNDSRRPVYQHFMASVSGKDAGLYSGEPTDWVKMRDINDETGWRKSYDLSTEVPSFDSKTTANQWIRANCSPDVTLNQGKKIYRHYQHMWFLWNFDASYKYGLWMNATEEDKNGKYKGFDKSYEDNWGWKDDSPATVVNPWGAKWYERNGKRLYEWMNPSLTGNKAIGIITIDIGESNNDVFFKYIPKSGEYAYCKKVGDYYGVQLPEIGNVAVTSETEGMMTFQARTSGTLRIRWGSADSRGARLGVQTGTTYYAPVADVTSETPIDWTVPGNGQNYLDITVEGNSVPVYIFGAKGNAIVYSIEFIRGRYLYETDREGIAPNPNQGIPMYGVKHFDKIPDWQRGTTHNLQGVVSLIRALAKVEIYIKGSFGQPRHVYMREINRAARCEPMDVHTSTDSLWVNDHLVYTGEGACEWFRIQKYGPVYNKMSEADYPNWLSWFYGSWKYDPSDSSPILWKNQGEGTSYEYNGDLGYYVPKGQMTGWTKSSFNYSGYTTEQPPHIFNPYMYRSSYCRFLYAGYDTQGGGYYKYVLYLPEKNIDDPSTAGKPETTPKVPHIEYRFPPRNSASTDDEDGDEDVPSAVASVFSNTEYNLDDDDCYRIYFTNYGESTASDAEGSIYGLDKNPFLTNGTKWNYDNYERSRERLAYHWPIVRNHRYQLYVGGAGPESPEIHVKVSDWGHRKVVLEW